MAKRHGANDRTSLPFTTLENPLDTDEALIPIPKDDDESGWWPTCELNNPLKLIGRIPRPIAQSKIVFRGTFLIARDTLQPLRTNGKLYAGILELMPKKPCSPAPSIRHVHDGNRVLPQHSRQTFDQTLIRIAHIVRGADAMLPHEFENGGDLLGRKVGNGGLGHGQMRRMRVKIQRSLKA